MCLRIFFSLLLALLFTQTSYSQRFLTDMMDTTTSSGKGIYPLYQKYDRLRFGGYMQPQFQLAQDEGISSFAGGDFANHSNSRFMLRRGRLRVDYLHSDTKGNPLAFFAFQFDGTERGVNIRDFWGRFYENKLKLFSLTTGMFARPMGFEVNLSSSVRETPERGRMSQILMKTERDIGAMLTFENRSDGNWLKWMKLNVGLFNGQGLAGTTDYDSHKDIISRFMLKPQTLRNGWIISGGMSMYYGGITSRHSVRYDVAGSGEVAYSRRDSSLDNIGSLAPRRYYGADLQIKIPNQKKFTTEFRLEYIQGLQTGTANNSATPGSYPTSGTELAPLYTRRFNGAYLYYIQNVGSEDLQFLVKYDWYDPNTRVSKDQVSIANGFSAADVKYSTLGVGFLYHLNTHVKTFLYYDWVQNEQTKITGYEHDIKDNVLTIRMQYRF